MQGGTAAVGVHHSGRWALSWALGAAGRRAVGTVWIKVRGDRDQVGRPGSRGNGLWERAVPPPFMDALALVSWSCPDQVQKYRSTSRSTLPPPSSHRPHVLLLPARPFSFSARGGGVCVGRRAPKRKTYRLVHTPHHHTPHTTHTHHTHTHHTHTHTTHTHTTHPR